jgi:hypothetical protein
MERWSAQRRAYIIERFLKNGVSLVNTQRIFCKHFNIACHGKFPCRNTTQLWVENFITSASALKNKPPGSVRRMRSPEHIESVKQSFILSPRPSERRILHKVSKFPSVENGGCARIKRL